jgi:hypothetical protein
MQVSLANAKYPLLAHIELQVPLLMLTTHTLPATQERTLCTASKHKRNSMVGNASVCTWRCGDGGAFPELENGGNNPVL